MIRLKQALIVVDMQKDFIDGALGTVEAVKILPNVLQRVENAEKQGEEILFTMDTHGGDYFDTQEGGKLPVPHCIRGTEGWNLAESLRPFAGEQNVFYKNTFGSTKLAEYLEQSNRRESYDRIELVGLCTDICVISNALLLKAFLPETELAVRASCCAGVTPQSHDNAIAAMRMCQITIVQ